MMIHLLLIAAVLIAIGAVSVVILAIRAPEGYEYEDGFHIGHEPME